MDQVDRSLRIAIKKHLEQVKKEILDEEVERAAKRIRYRLGEILGRIGFAVSSVAEDWNSDIEFRVTMTRENLMNGPKI